MLSSSKPIQYRVYMLRFWQEGSQAEASVAWRFSLEDPHTGERFGFADCDGLYAFLNEEISKEPQADGGGLSSE
jgi:hypothetical protein